ncbi:hypothetical protein FRC10_006981, partial [Ceratobasidium sp. 414]
ITTKSSHYIRKDIAKGEVLTVGENWAELPEKLLRKQEAKVFPALATIINFLGKATGTEIHANLVWHNGQTTVSRL